MNTRHTLGFVCVTLILLFVQSASSNCQVRGEAPNVDSAAAVNSWLHEKIGEHVKLRDSNHPTILKGDLNGDGISDLVVVVDVEKSINDLKASSVKVIDTDSLSPSNGQVLDAAKLEPHNCAGLLLIHGSREGWSRPLALFLTYDCFSGTRLVAKTGRIPVRATRRTPAPRLLGDAVQLEMENGSSRLVYWTGRSYKGLLLRTGD